MPWNPKQFWAIEFHTKSRADREKFAREQGMGSKSAKKVANQIKPENSKDKNADKNINPNYEGNDEQKAKVNESMENGFSEEQAKAAPNDTLVKDSEDADISTKDSSPENLKKIKLGDPTADVEPGSDFEISKQLSDKYGLNDKDRRELQRAYRNGDSAIINHIKQKYGIKE